MAVRIGALSDCDVASAMQKLLVSLVCARSVSEICGGLEDLDNLVACAHALETRRLQVLMVELVIDE